MEARFNHLDHKFTVAVIGGGFTGTTLAAQLVRHTDPSFSVVVIERTGSPGRGVAYGTECDSHLLNVPAKDMSAFPDDREHFLRWAKSNYDSETEACRFLPRKVYGRYLGSLLSEATLACGQQRLQWKKDEARALSPRGDGEIEIQLRSGTRVFADKVVLALGNFPASDPLLPWRNPANRAHDPPDPFFADPYLADPHFSDPYFANPWSDTIFEAVEHLDQILLLGSGLTGVDVAVELRRRGFRGTIHFLSRRGLLPQSHKAHTPWPVFWNEHSPKNARGLLRLVHDQVREAEQQGVDWRGVITSLRQVTPRIWQSLPEEEKRRFLRHVRPYWEVHRHRAAPQIAQLIDSQRLSGQVRLHAGRITHYREDGRRAEIAFRERKRGEECCLSVDRVINCTAPETDCRRLQDPLMCTLLDQGLVRPDPLLLGLDVSADGALIGQDGIASDSIYAVGPARKGSLWESTAVPEIRDQVDKLVEHFVNASGPAHHIDLGSADQDSRDVTNA